MDMIKTLLFIIPLIKRVR